MATIATTTRKYLCFDSQDSDCPMPAVRNGGGGAIRCDSRLSTGGTTDCPADAGAGCSLPLGADTTGTGATGSFARTDAVASFGTLTTGEARVETSWTLVSVIAGRASFATSAGVVFADCGDGTRSWPRQRFSSHSTQSWRPSETGKPQVWHLCRFLSTGGTWLSSASGFPAELGDEAAAVQNNGLPGVAAFVARAFASGIWGAGISGGGTSDAGWGAGVCGAEASCSAAGDKLASASSSGLGSAASFATTAGFSVVATAAGTISGDGTSNDRTSSGGSGDMFASLTAVSTISPRRCRAERSRSSKALTLPENSSKTPSTCSSLTIGITATEAMPSSRQPARLTRGSRSASSQRSGRRPRTLSPERPVSAE